MTPIIPEKIERYCTEHSAPASALADELDRYTREHWQSAQMLCGRWEASLLRLLVAVTGARRVLELGLFTGYSALNIAEALPQDGEIVSCEIEQKNADLARRFLDRSAHGHKVKIRIGAALDTLRNLAPSFDLVFLDADKENYGAYLDRCLPLLRQNGLIVADNVLWSGRVFEPKEASDRAIVAFNDKVRDDPRVESVMLPLRDGVSVIRKR
jgi:caffeoyl-CoA O-methyltransferase